VTESASYLPDGGALLAWLSTQGIQSDRIQVEPVTGGASNLIYRITLKDRTLALRRPPLVSNDPTSNNLLREISLLRAIGKTNIPHTRLVTACETAHVIGAPFELLEWHAGFTAKDPLPGPFDQDPAAREALAFELVDALATVSNVDWRSIGLGNFGKPEGFLERQVDRWLGQLERYRTRDIPGLDELANWLRGNTPAMQRAGLVHGDYQFINVMYDATLPVRLSAIVDWESATIGDPLLDLGWMLASWQEPGEPETFASYISWQAFPPRHVLAQRYEQATGLSVAQLGYYMALAMFKLGIIMEGAYARFAKGRSNHPMHAQMEAGVPAMIQRGLDFSQRY
jgi:aminoglycoside phosphotransferase (APT) family kinase protein